MPIGKRIKYFRTMRGITQKDLGEKIGIEEYPRVRVAQYEAGLRNPKEEVKQEIAKVLNVSPEALEADVSNVNMLAQLFFALEDEYGIKAYRVGDEIILRTNNRQPKTLEILNIIEKWADKNELVEKKVINKEEYNEWKYSYSNKQGEIQ